MSFLTDRIFSRCTKLYFFVKFAPSPCLPQLTQEVHNNWGQTQEAGRAVVLQSYFSYPLLPSQAQAASGSPPEQLRQLLHGPRKAGTGRQLSIFSLSVSENNQFLFFVRQIRVVGIRLPKRFEQLCIHADDLIYNPTQVFQPNRRVMDIL